VRLLNVGSNPVEPKPRVLHELKLPLPGPVPVSGERGFNAIEVQFVNAPVEPATVPRGFEVAEQRDVGEVVLSGQVVDLGGNSNTVRWVTRGFTDGRYRVTLFGDGRRAILSRTKRPLDGEARQLPSGDGEEGGNFTFEFVTRFL
jgi:hypothetical protein